MIKINIVKQRKIGSKDKYEVIAKYVPGKEAIKTLETIPASNKEEAKKIKRTLTKDYLIKEHKLTKRRIKRTRATRRQHRR